MPMVFQLNLSSTPSMLENASALIQLAQNTDKHTSLLSACAMVVLGAALDQALYTSLRSLATLEAAETKVAPEATPAYRLLHATLRGRFVEAPALVSRGTFKIRSGSPLVQTIHELITLRNELLHIREDPVVLQEGTDPEVLKLADDFYAVVVDTNLVRNPWSQVTLADAQSSLIAVRLYLDTVLQGPFGNSDMLTASA